MNPDTGEIISEVELEKLSPEEQSRFVPLSPTQFKKYGRMSPEKRVIAFRNDQVVKSKKIKAMRSKTKRQHKAMIEARRKK